jgi:hypothetical protein
LPPYAVPETILAAFLEKRLTPAWLINTSPFEGATVKSHLVKAAEFKRGRMAQVLKSDSQHFGMGLRMRIQAKSGIGIALRVTSLLRFLVETS